MVWIHIAKTLEAADKSKCIQLSLHESISAFQSWSCQAGINRQQARRNYDKNVQEKKRAKPRLD